MSSFVVETVARGGGDGSFGYKTGRIVGVKRLNVGQCPVGTMLMASVNRWNSRSNTFFVVSSHALARKCEDITARPWWWCGYNFPKFTTLQREVPLSPLKAAKYVLKSPKFPLNFTLKS